MITLQADFNHMDAQGRLRLDDLRMHRQTPFAEIAAKHVPIIFVDGEDYARLADLYSKAGLAYPVVSECSKMSWSASDCRHTAVPIGATSEPRDRRQFQNTPAGRPGGVGEEYAIRASANPTADQSAHRRAANPNRRRFVRSMPEGAFCHAAKRGHRAEGPCAVPTRTTTGGILKQPDNQGLPARARRPRARVRADRRGQRHPDDAASAGILGPSGGSVRDTCVGKPTSRARWRNIPGGSTAWAKPSFTSSNGWTVGSSRSSDASTPSIKNWTSESELDEKISRHFVWLVGAHVTTVVTASDRHHPEGDGDQEKVHRFWTPEQGGVKRGWRENVLCGRPPAANQLVLSPPRSW